MACIVRNCTGHTSKKAVLCSAHWAKIPKDLQDALKKDIPKGEHTLRAQPSREWVQAASKHVGEVKNLSIFVDAASKIKRKFQTEEKKKEA